MYWPEGCGSTCTDEWWAEAAQEGPEDGLGVPEEDRGFAPTSGLSTGPRIGEGKSRVSSMYFCAVVGKEDEFSTARTQSH